MWDMFDTPERTYAPPEIFSKQWKLIKRHTVTCLLLAQVQLKFTLFRKKKNANSFSKYLQPII